MALVEVRNLRKVFGKKAAVEDLSFEIEAGDIVGFVGPNGSGKTTTMRMMATLLEPTQGDVRVDGHSILDDPREVRRVMGFMPDAFGVYDRVTVREFLIFFAGAYRIPKDQRKKVTENVMELTDLTGLADTDASVMSKGMKQRLCLAKTLLHDPGLLILDEPASGLDPRARIELRGLIGELKVLGKAVFISSHILTELGEMCDRVVIIESGKLVADGTPSDIASRQGKGTTRVVIRCMDGTASLMKQTSADGAVLKSVAREDRVEILVDGGDEAAAALLARLVQSGLRIAEFRPLRGDLEEAFLRVTKGDVG